MIEPIAWFVTGILIGIIATTPRQFALMLVLATLFRFLEGIILGR